MRVEGNRKVKEAQQQQQEQNINISVINKYLIKLENEMDGKHLNYSVEGEIVLFFISFCRRSFVPCWQCVRVCECARFFVIVCSCIWNNQMRYQMLGLLRL